MPAVTAEHRSATVAAPARAPGRSIRAVPTRARSGPGGPGERRGPFWLWLLLSVAMVAGVVYLRIVVYPDRVVPLGYALPLLVCLWNRDLRLLWFMAISFAVLVLTKMLVVLPTWELAGAERFVFGLMQLATIFIAAGVIHAVVRLSSRLECTIASLEQTNAELEATNEELAARDEEISQQNEELQQQAEELEQQTEELGSQTEELQRANQLLAAREHTLHGLLDVSAADIGEGETLERLGGMIRILLGPRAIAAAVIEPDGDALVVNPLFGEIESECRFDRSRMLAGLVMSRNTPAFLADTSLRPDIELPKLEGGARIASVMAAPFRAGSAPGAAGVVEFYSDTVGEWSDDDLRLAHWAAEQCGRMWQAARLREELDRQRHILRTTCENSTVGLVMLDVDGRCTFMNPAAETKFGRSFGEVQGELLHNLVHRHSAGEPCELETAIAQHHRLRDYEAELVRKDGSTFFARCSLSPLVVDGRPSGMVLEVRDITLERMRHEEREALLRGERAARLEADRAGRAKDEFVATLSHELRTPLNAILGWASLLRTVKDAQEVDRGLEIIERNARSQAQLISDLLDISRITAGRLRLEVAPVDPREVVESAVDAVRPIASAKGVTLETSLETIDAVLLGDAGRLRQVVWNLLSNAVKFTPRGGSVRASLVRSGECVEITVNDTGHGIEPELLPQLFERYRQGDSSPTRHQGGLGLGLAIVKHLVELHGGTVSLTSEGRGRGATCSVVLPLGSAATPDCVPRPDAAPVARLPRLDGVSVLVVDDDEDSRELAGRILADQGASVRWASNAADAEKAIRAQRPDLLVSDLGMPGVDGYQLVQRLREEFPPDVMPAVALTAFARAEDRLRAMDAGFQGHIAKPLEAADLVRVVAELRARSRDGHDRQVSG